MSTPARTLVRLVTHRHSLWARGDFYAASLVALLLREVAASIIAEGVR